MAPGPPNESSRCFLIFKWGGCCSAFLFAVGGLLLDMTSPGDAYESLNQGIWIIVAISMAVGLTGVILDRSDLLPKS